MTELNSSVPCGLEKKIKENDVESRSVESAPSTDQEKQLNRLYWKLDLRILPPLWILYFLTSAVRSNVGLALTMNKSTGHSLMQYIPLSPHHTSLGVALFYIGYLVFDIPFNVIMTKVAPQAWLARNVILVGIIGACMTAMRSSWSFLLLRLLLGISEAGLWPGMAYYLTLWYPPHQIAQRVGGYFTAAQLSAAVVGLVSAGFQLMDGARGLTGYEWMFMVYGLVTFLVGVSLFWWLPDRPQVFSCYNDEMIESELQQSHSKGTSRRFSRFFKALLKLPKQPPVLKNPVDKQLHAEELARYSSGPIKWTWRDLANTLLDVRLWPLVIMYFGVVGTGIGLQTFATVILSRINPEWSGVILSLLSAPIWICDLIAILLVTPISDKYHKYRAIFFSVPCLIIIAGLCVTTYAPHAWAKYAGLLITGFGLGPTVPICMTWSAEIFQPTYGELGVAIATAAVSGFGNLGSVTTTYALYTGWPSDATNGYRDSNMVMLALVGLSIVAAFVCSFTAKRDTWRLQI